jgi:hypothetical protein
MAEICIYRPSHTCVDDDRGISSTGSQGEFDKGVNINAALIRNPEALRLPMWLNPWYNASVTR